MRATFKLAEPDKLEATLSLRATIGDFKRMRELIKEGKPWAWPLSELSSCLDSVVSSSTAQWDANAEFDEHGSEVKK